MLRRSPRPPPSSRKLSRDPSQNSVASKTGGGAGQLGAFWSTQYAKESSSEDKNEPKFDEEPTSVGTVRHDRNRSDKTQTQTLQRNSHESSKDFEISVFQKDTHNHIEKPKGSITRSSETFKDDAFNSFVVEFDVRKLGSEFSRNKKSSTEQALEAEVENLKQQLKEVNLEKAEISSKFEKLSAICRAQRQEIQELKQTVAARIPSPNKDASKNQASPGTRPPAAALVDFIFLTFNKHIAFLFFFIFLIFVTWIYFVNRIGIRLKEKLMNFSMKKTTETPQAQILRHGRLLLKSQSHSNLSQRATPPNLSEQEMGSRTSRPLK